MEIKRDRYLRQLISYMWNGQVKVITGIRRCGKSYLLNILFRKHLLSQGVKKERILSVLVTGIAIVVFGIFYAIVYRITSNAYYSIVSGRKEQRV